MTSRTLQMNVRLSAGPRRILGTAWSDIVVDEAASFRSDLPKESIYVTSVPWPQRSAAGICHVHPECNEDPVMAARCRGFSDACVRGVAPPVWESNEDTFFEAGPAWTVGLDPAESRDSTSFLTVTHVDHDTGTVTLAALRPAAP